MSHTPPYIERFHQPGPFRALAAGKTGRPETLPAGGAKAIGKIVFSGNFIAGDTVTLNGSVLTAKAAAAPAVGKIVFTGVIIAGDTVTVNGKLFTCMVSGAAGEFQFDVGGSLSLSLDALITKLNACTDPLVSYATYSKTDTNTAVTSTSDTNNTADNSKLLASNHSSVVITQPTGAVNAATSVQFDVAGTLSLSLDNLVTQANASALAAISYATYSKTDANTALTSTSDGYAYADNLKVLASTHATVVITQPVGGQDRPAISLDTESTEITNAAGTEQFTLAAGDKFQRKTILNSGAAIAVITGTFAGGTTLTLDPGEYACLQWLNAEWKLPDSTGAVT